ncbi:MAG: hypothetical protein ACTHU0_28905 [Kofleriaceae bacterium]
MSIRSLFTLSSLIALAACGDDGNSNPPVDAPKDTGFNKPTATLKANQETGGTWMEVGPADLTSCANAADLPSTVAIELKTTVKDFQTNNLVPNTTVTAFPNSDINSPFDTKTADANAELTIDIPVGTKRFGYKMTNAASLDTLLLNQTVRPDVAMQMVSAIQSVSKTTAQTLPSFVGVTRTSGTGVLAGAMRDCQGREVSNFIATVSSTKGTVTQLEGADTYYFSSAVGLPVRHAQKASASEDGLFMVIELPPTASAYVQVWGFPTDADLAAGDLKLIAELPTAVIADTVITGSYEPLRAGQ